MATIITRAGKGSPLTNTELDANFNNLNRNLPVKLLLDFGADLPGVWRTLVTATLQGSPATYSTQGFRIKITDPNANHATQSSVTVDEVVYYVACVRSETLVIDTPDLCVVRGPAQHIRAVKTATGVYEIQVQPETQYREYLITIETYAINGTHTIVYGDGSVVGGAGTAVYSAVAGNAITWVGKLQATGSITTNSELVSQGSTARFSLYRNDGVNYFDWSSGQSLYFSTQTSAGGAGRSTLMTLNASGQLDIGMGANYGRLNVQRDAAAPYATVTVGDQTTATNTVGIYLRQTSGVAGISTAGADLEFYTGGPGTTPRLSIDSSGNVTPGVTNTQTLGAVGDVWSNVHATTFTGALSGNATTATSVGSLTGIATVAPLAHGTAAVGTSTLGARQDHVHPAQTTISGNAATATNSTQLGGIAAANFIYGDNGSGSTAAAATQNVYELAQYKSGFWEINLASWTPTTNWYWGATFAHKSNTSVYNYSGQLAFEISGGGNSVYARTIDGGTPTTWSKLLSSGNYNNYSPTLTGTGASGTWGIAITGNAATLSNFLVNNTVNNGQAVAQNYIGYVTDYSGTALTASVADGALYNQYFSGSWQHQIYGDYRTGQIAVRGKNNGTWQAWRTQLDSANYNSYSPTLTGGSASGTWGISVTGNAASASYVVPYSTSTTTGVKTGRTVQYTGLYNYSANSDTNAPTTYIAAVGFGAGTGGTGEIAVNWVTGGGGIWYRGLRDTIDNWFAWTRILDTANYNSYSPSLTGTSASGTWSIAITGNAGSATTAATCSGNSSTATTATNQSGGTVSATTIAASSTITATGAVSANAGIGGTLRRGSYGAISVNGSNGGYSGIDFYDHSATLMVNGTLSGIYRNNSTWDWYFTGSTLTVGTVPAANVSGTVSSASTCTGAAASNVLKTGDTMTGTLDMNSTSPTINLRDTDGMPAFLHCNSNLLYILRHATANSTSWDTGPNGRHPMTINLSTGDVTFSGNVAAYSDARLKKNITTIANPLHKVKQLVGVSFEKLEGQKGIGLIAQNVRDVLPDVVTEDKDGYLSVAYGNIVGLLVEAIKEQQQLIDTQEKRIVRLEQLLNKLIEG